MLMPTDRTTYCPNCYYPMPQTGPYCGHCGQKYTTGRVRIWTLIGDFLESIFNVDSNILRTTLALFVPGKLTRDYFEGKHKRYVSPLRLFFATAVVLFAVLGLYLFTNLESQMTRATNKSRYQAYLSSFRNQLDSARAQAAALFPEGEAQLPGLDSLSALIEDPRKDSFNLVYFKRVRTGLVESVPVAVSMEDLMEMPLDSLPPHYGIRGFWHQLQVRQLAKLNREGGDFTRFALSKLIWMAVLMMPAIALMLKLLYIRRRYFYVEHLVFTLHYHAFAFFCLSAVLLVANTGWGYTLGEFLFPISILGTAFYLYKAMRRFYRQRRFKTLLKFGLLNFAYLCIFTAFALLMAVVATLAY
ncbi:DUF3667 domain-containing protein [Phaeodactylibacter luteus]|uniref:DUF3667 domain-containing protein n=1 Tax=Phaeodactylibacter luteus TaxID=1564516 RepID=A0A5C6RM74_9BACT|nr:DUF3667 domain-containing protein [Phaeodactylibacter luteus]TXB63054.1 DUF3667 domain-containing protein [Phaeodactylibacter luteus]